MTVDLATEAASDPQVTSVMVDVAGLEFQRSDGSSDKMEFATPTRSDLVDFMQNNPFRMFTDEMLSQGTYTGVRLIIVKDDNSANVFRSDGTQYPLLVADGEYTPIDFTVEKNKSSRESLALTLDLRRSLTYDAGNLQYSLTPVLRSVPTDKAAQISGNVAITCPVGTSLATGGAVYLYTGEDVDPNDIGSAVQPYATTAITTNFLNAQPSYTLRFLAAGDYTIAATCNGNDDSPSSDDSVTFIGTGNVQVSEAETATRNLTN
ncbi:MAG TPA: DUF4382 domain-containing protein [Povalibacter sp.]|nr:DUF4382 domain-containing protein [Povalibacter sp.]